MPSVSVTYSNARWWGIGIGALIWIVLFIWLGLRTLRNGHGWMFFLGIFLPILWIIGAFMQPARQEMA
jgi:hypothetical protein